MHKVFGNRASNILFQFLLNLKDKNIIFYIPANICPIVPAVFVKANIKFTFIDIDKKTYEIDRNKFLNSNLVKKKFGILWTNGYGRHYDNKKFFINIKSLNDDNVIIDDKCLEIPNIKLKQSVADLTLFSTGYSKYIDLNFGGFGYINSELKYTYQSYNNKNYQSLIKNFHYSIDNQLKIKINLLNQNWLDHRLKFKFKSYENKIKKYLPKIKNHKKKINKIYTSIIPNKMQLDSSYNNWRFNIRVKNTKKVLKEIFEKNLFASSHYYPANLLFNNQKLTNANKSYNEVLNLFNDFRFNEQQALQISEIVKKSLI